MLGALLGLLTNSVSRTGDRLGRLLRIIIGVIGAVVGGLLVATQTWEISLAGLTVGGALAALASALIFLLVARLARITG
jgi:uncharacterized membrane protein YeaQ/YmgE (transglycosylase-associated protein family)